MIDCFPTKNYIGIRGDCDGETPESGLYINDLAGITLKLAASSATEEDVRGIDMLRRLETLAIDLAAQDFLMKLSPKVQFKKVCDTARVGFHDKDDFTAPQLRTKVGVELEKYGNDRYKRLYVEYIEIKVKETVKQKIVYIEDSSGVTQKKFNIKPGMNKLYLNYTSKDDCVKVYFDADDVTLYDNEGIYTGAGCCECWSDSQCFKVKGIIDYLGGEGWEDATSYNGIGISAQCKCDSNELVCQYRDELRFAIWYRMGILVMDEVLATDRSNPLVRNSKESARQNLLKWHGGINPQTGFEEKGEYHKSVWQVVNQVRYSINPHETDCMVCESLKVVSAIP